MNAHADMFIVAERNELNTPRGIYRSPVLGMWKFARFCPPKQAPINAFYYVCYPPPVDVQTSPTLVHGAKVVNYFGLSKKRVIFGWFLFRNWWVNFFRKRVNFFRKRILRKVLWGKQGVEAEFCRSSLGRRSVFSRWNKGRYKRGKRDGNLNKTHIS